MTRQRSFKRLVRARMAKTGESYTAARAQLLAAASTGPKTEQAPLVTTDERISERTGTGWEAWFDLLDEAGGLEMTHRDTAKWVAARLGIGPLAWDAQAIAASYERARGIRDVGEHPDGFRITASRTVAVPVEALYEAVTDAERCRAWLPGDRLRTRTATAAKSAHYDWGDDGSRLHVHFNAKGADRSAVSVEHTRLADAAARDRMKRFWTERLSALKDALEGGEIDG